MRPHSPGWHRNHAHDRQGAIERRRRWANSRAAILFTGWIRSPYHVGLGRPLALTATEPAKTLWIGMQRVMDAVITIQILREGYDTSV
ncbi:hypothetical protein FSB64_38545 [Paraburkholderia sp. JPY454]|uniref:Uncharacterized protein n=1 Tax=Paraburkholderia youngii TaxID=2782701 RepID=A0ABX2NYB5_9BURK|nr:hypothetical protein [Paraburkholderia youngii]